MASQAESCSFVCSTVHYNQPTCFQSTFDRIKPEWQWMVTFLNDYHQNAAGISFLEIFETYRASFVSSEAIICVISEGISPVSRRSFFWEHWNSGVGPNCGPSSFWGLKDCHHCSYPVLRWKREVRKMRAFLLFSNFVLCTVEHTYFQLIPGCKVVVNVGDSLDV